MGKTRSPQLSYFNMAIKREKDPFNPSPAFEQISGFNGGLTLSTH